MKLEITGSQGLAGSDVTLKKISIIVIIEVDDFYLPDSGPDQEAGTSVPGGEQCGPRLDSADAAKGRYPADPHQDEVGPYPM